MLEDGGFLVILDFDVPTNYSNDYEPNQNLRSYKIDNSKVLCASGLYNLLDKNLSASHIIE